MVQSVAADARAFYRGRDRRGAGLVALARGPGETRGLFNGNAAVKDAVAAGACVAGFTDTDDFFEARDAGKPVAMRPVRLAGGETICIPNTIAIIQGSRRMAEAQRLVDFLLSEETELALAQSKSRQIPLGPVSDEKVPAEVRELRSWARDAFPLAGLVSAHGECLAWLKAELLQ